MIASTLALKIKEHDAFKRLRATATEAAAYFVVSLIALAVDFGLLVVLTEVAHLNYLVSAAIGFSAGLVVNYLLSVTFVFRERRMANRGAELLIFAAIGLAGLALNEVIIKLFVEILSAPYYLAKIPATALGFCFNYGARRSIIFTARKMRVG